MLGSPLRVWDFWLQTWYSLGSAHVLVLSRSTFSYSAALYAEGVVVYTAFRHQPLPSWVVAERGDPAQLARAVGDSPALGQLERKLAQGAAPCRAARVDHEQQSSVYTLYLA